MRRFALLLLAAVLATGSADALERWQSVFAKKQSGTRALYVLPNATVVVYEPGATVTSASSSTTINVDDSSTLQVGETIEVAGQQADIAQVVSSTQVRLDAAVSVVVGDRVLRVDDSVPLYSDFGGASLLQTADKKTDSGGYFGFYVNSTTYPRFDLKAVLGSEVLILRDETPPGAGISQGGGGGSDPTNLVYANKTPTTGTGAVGDPWLGWEAHIATGKAIYFPPGYYEGTSGGNQAIPDGASIVCAPGARIRRPATRTAGTWTFDAPSTTASFSVFGCTFEEGEPPDPVNYDVDGGGGFLRIGTTDSATAQTFRIEGNTFGPVKHKSTGTAAITIEIRGSTTNSNISNNKFDYAVHAVRFASESASVMWLNTSITDNQFHYTAPKGPNPDQWQSYVQIGPVVTNGNEEALAKGLNVSGNTFTGYGGWGVTCNVYCDSLVFSGNTINLDQVADYTVKIGTGSSRNGRGVTITGNQAWLSEAMSGVKVLTILSAYNDNVTISGNTIYSQCEHDMIEATGGTGIVISGNQIRNYPGLTGLCSAIYAFNVADSKKVAIVGNNMVSAVSMAGFVRTGTTASELLIADNQISILNGSLLSFLDYSTIPTNVSILNNRVNDSTGTSLATDLSSTWHVSGNKFPGRTTTQETVQPAFATPILVDGKVTLGQADAGTQTAAYALDFSPLAPTAGQSARWNAQVGRYEWFTPAMIEDVSTFQAPSSAGLLGIGGLTPTGYLGLMWDGDIGTYNQAGGTLNLTRGIDFAWTGSSPVTARLIVNYSTLNAGCSGATFKVLLDTNGSTPPTTELESIAGIGVLSDQVFETDLIGIVPNNLELRLRVDTPGGGATSCALRVHEVQLNTSSFTIKPVTRNYDLNTSVAGDLSVPGSLTLGGSPASITANGETYYWPTSYPATTKTLCATATGALDWCDQAPGWTFVPSSVPVFSNANASSGSRGFASPANANDSDDATVATAEFDSNSTTTATQIYGFAAETYTGNIDIRVSNCRGPRIVGLPTSYTYTIDVCANAYGSLTDVCSGGGWVNIASYDRTDLQLWDSCTVLEHNHPVVSQAMADVRIRVQASASGLNATRVRARLHQLHYTTTGSNTVTTAANVTLGAGADLTFTPGTGGNTVQLQAPATLSTSRTCQFDSSGRLPDDCVGDGTDNTSVGASYSTVYDEGNSLTQRSNLKFIGTTVSCQDNDPYTECTFTGGGGSGYTALHDGTNTVSRTGAEDIQLLGTTGITVAVSEDVNHDKFTLTLDSDLTDLADGSLTGTAVGPGIVGTNIQSGTVSAAFIDSAIARDSELPTGDDPAGHRHTTTSILSLDVSDITTGTLAMARGGTGLSASADDNVMVGNGTAWQTKALPSCDESQTLAYDPATNLFSCATDSGFGGGITAFTLTDTDSSPTLTVNDGENIQFYGTAPITASAAADGSNHDITYACSDATVGAKGCAQFSDTFFSVTTGTVSLDNLTGDVTTSGGLITTIAANAVALGTDTTNSYVQQVNDGTGIDGTANAESATYTPVFDATELTALTWSAGGSASFTHTYDVTTGTDPQLTFSNGLITSNVALAVAQSATGGVLDLYEGSGNGTNKISFVAPDSITSDRSCALVDGAAMIPDACTVDQTSVTGNAGTATALATDPTACSANQYVSDIAAAGTLTCSQPAFSNLSGSVGDSQIAAGAVDGGNLGEIADDSITADDLAANSVGSSEMAVNWALGDAEGGNATGLACAGSCVSNAEVDNDITASNYLELAGGTLTGNLTLSADAGEGVLGGGLTDCDNGTTSKLLWDSTTNKFSCGTDQGGQGTGDSITVNSTAATDPDFLDNIYVDFAIDTGASPDNITAKPNYNAATGDHGLLTTEVAFAANGLVAEGTTADTIEMYLQFPDPASSDKTLTFPNVTGTLVSTGDTGSVTTGMITDATIAPGDIDVTGEAWIFDGASTSLEVPNGTGPTVDAAGEIAVDTTANQLVYYSAAAHVSDPRKTLSAVLMSPVDADTPIIFKAPYGMTITDIDCIVGAATSAVIDVQECSGTGTGCATVDATITCDTDGAADDGTLSNGSIDAGDWIKLDIGTVTGTVTYVSVTITYTIVRE